MGTMGENPNDLTDPYDAADTADPDEVTPADLGLDEPDAEPFAAPYDEPYDEPGAGGLWVPSRRGLLTGAAVVGAGAAAAGAGVSPAAAALPMVRPIPSHSVLARFGVNALPNFLTTGYDARAAWMARLDELGVRWFRGFYASGLPETRDVTRLARQHNLKWGMAVARDIETPDDEIRSTIRHIARYAADRCLYIEGINEPDWDRDREAAPPNWHARAVHKQRVIWRAVKSHRSLRKVKVLSPSLRDVSARPRDYAQLADLGILQYFDFAAIHRYPNGHYPDQLLRDRKLMLRRQWRGKRIWITETGYHNALATTSGSRPVPEWVAAIYAPSVILEAVDRGFRAVTWFELLDNPDAGAKDVPEHNFGLYATRDGAGPPWRAKPAARAYQDFLASLRDPGKPFRPAARRLEITVTDGPRGGLRRTVTAKRNGAVTVHLRRATDCWDVETQQQVPVERSQVRIATSNGVRRVAVDHRVQSIRVY